MLTKEISIILNTKFQILIHVFWAKLRTLNWPLFIGLLQRVTLTPDSTKEKFTVIKFCIFFPTTLLFSPILLYVICHLGGRKLQRSVMETVKQGLQEEELLRNFCWNRRCGGHSRTARYPTGSTGDTLQTELGELDITKVNDSSQGALEISNGKEG